MGDSLSFELDMAAIRKKKGQKKKLTQAEQERWDENQADMELVEQFERKPLKSVQCGLGASFYEYNELAVQFGYITMFSVVLPIGALFALANNFLDWASPDIPSNVRKSVARDDWLAKSSFKPPF